MSKFRTLGRCVSFTDTTYEIIFPSIDAHKTFMIDRSIIPFTLGIETRFYVKANLDAEVKEDLDLSDFQFIK